MQRMDRLSVLAPDSSQEYIAYVLPDRRPITGSFVRVPRFLNLILLRVSEEQTGTML